MQFQCRDAIDIDTSPERAWATMVDVEGWPRWTPKTRRYLRQGGGRAEGLVRGLTSRERRLDLGGHRFER